MCDRIILEQGETIYCKLPTLTIKTKTMKKSLTTPIYTFGTIICCLLMLSSCSTTQQATSGDSVTVEREYRELIDMLYTVPGLDIQKLGGDYDITIRGKNTIRMDHQPLYVVDGMVRGTTYAEVANTINVQDVDRVNVLKGSAATSYGSRGGNGVIEIFLKRGL